VDKSTQLIESVFQQLEADRKSGKLTKGLIKNLGYGISSKYPNYISKYNSEGIIVAIGYYKNEGFLATKLFVVENKES